MWSLKINSSSGKYTPFIDEHVRMFCYVDQWCDVWEMGLWGMTEIKRQTEIIEIICERNMRQHYQTSSVAHTCLCWDTLTSSGEMTSVWPTKLWKCVNFLFVPSRCLARRMPSVPDGDDREKCTHRTFPTLVVITFFNYMLLTVYNA